MIAARYDMTTPMIRAVNHMSSDELKVGQQLRIPSAELAGEP
jgi:N-acetylmuramoyl-L-alanine amidase